MAGVCVGESIVGVIDGVTKALATVPPMVFVTVPGVKMRNPVGVDNGALTRTKLLAPLYGEATGAMTGMVEVAGVAVRGGVDITVDNVLGKLVDDRVVNEEMDVLLAPKVAGVVCGEPIVRTGVSTVEVEAPVEIVLVKGCRLLVEFKLAMVVVGTLEDTVYGVDVLVFVADDDDNDDDKVVIAGDPAGVGSETPGRVVMAVLGGISYF